MSSQFRNSNIAYYLYSAIIILIGAASIFVFWYMVSGFNIGRYSERTFIGSVYIGGLTEREAEIKLRSRIGDWLDDDRVLFEVRYQGYTYVLNRDRIEFDVSQSMRDIEDGRVNTLYAEIPTRQRDIILDEIESTPFLQGIERQFDLEKVLNDFERDARNMRTFASKQLNQYIINPSVLITTLHTSTLEIPDYIDGTQLINKLDSAFPEGLEVNPKSTLRFLETFGPEFTSKELSFLGALIMDMIPHTHFNVFEREYLSQIDTNFYTEETFPYFGRNVFIFRSQNIDFSFENYTHCEFVLEFIKVDNQLLLRLTGLPFLHEIEHETTTLQIPYQTSTTSNPQDVRAGVHGYVIFIERTITDIFGNSHTRRIIEEYYPPRNEIVLQGS